jgi:hypothetical protein
VIRNEFATESRGALVDLNHYFSVRSRRDRTLTLFCVSNGEYYMNNKPIEGLNKDVIVCGLKQAKNEYSQILNNIIHRYASESDMVLLL